MEGAAVLCTRGAMAAGAGMIRLGSPGDPAAAWPTEAVRMHLPAAGVGRRLPRGDRQVQGRRHRPRARHRRRRGGGDPGRHGRRSPVPLVIDADALTALGDAAAARTLLDKRERARASSRRTTASTPRIAGSAAGRRTASTRPAGWPRRRVRSSSSRARSPRWPTRRASRVARRAPGRRRRAGARHRRQRRRALGDHRRLLARGLPAHRGGRARRARARPGGLARPVAGPGRRRPARRCWPGCCRRWPEPGWRTRCRRRRLAAMADGARLADAPDAARPGGRRRR